MRPLRLLPSGRARPRAAAAAAVLAGAVLATSGPASAQSTSPAAARDCPGTFQVQSDTRIGALRLDRGPYVLAVAGGQSCAEAARSFARFLGESYDGRLPSPWRLDADARRFTRGSTTSAPAFTVTPVAPAEAPDARRGCPIPYTQERAVTVGGLSVPRGRFQLTLVAGEASCQRLTELIGGFLARSTSSLPNGWTYSSPVFANAASGLEFRWRLVGEATEGGGAFPGAGRACSGVVRFGADDRLGTLRVRRGRYRVAVTGDVSCATARRWVTAFARKTNGRLHSPWRVDPDTATFRRGEDAADGFRLVRVTAAG